MSKVTWVRVCFENAKTHLVCKGLMKALIVDMAKRDCTLMNFATNYGKDYESEEWSNPRVVTEWGIDMPGMINAKRPNELFNFCGLKFEVPSEDVASFILALEKLPPRSFGKQTYYKLHGFMQCVVLTKTQYNEMLRLLRGRVQIAERRATEFWAEREAPSEMLKRAQGLVDSPIDLGGHKNDRFYVKRGQA
jgi:hypothetical protein